MLGYLSQNYTYQVKRINDLKAEMKQVFSKIRLYLWKIFWSRSYCLITIINDKLLRYSASNIIFKLIEIIKTLYFRLINQIYGILFASYK